MKKKLFLSLVIATPLYLISSCRENKTEENKPEISTEVQSQLDETEKNWSDLTTKFADWSKNFSIEKAEWIANRKIDSIEIMVIDYGKKHPSLADAWVSILNSAKEREKEVNSWETTVINDIKKFNDEATAFSDWKNEAESGNFSEEEIKKIISENQEKIKIAHSFLESLEKSWTGIKETDKNVIASFEPLK